MKRLHEHIFYACQTILNRPEAFESVQQSLIRRVHECADTGRGHFEHFVCIDNLYCKCVTSVVSTRRILHNNKYLLLNVIFHLNSENHPFLTYIYTSFILWI